MSTNSVRPSQPRLRETDWRLLRRLLPYARQNQQLLAIALVMLIPLSLADAVQPILVGQAISVIRGDPTAWFLQGRTLAAGLNLLVGLLLVTILVQLSLNGVQNFLIQKVGQRITASIRADLFQHVTSLAVRFFDRTPVGRLITRLTSDVDALGDVFSTGAIGILSDLF